MAKRNCISTSFECQHAEIAFHGNLQTALFIQIKPSVYKGTLHNLAYSTKGGDKFFPRQLRTWITFFNI